MAKAYAPNGKEILGSYEMCPCRAEILGNSWERDKDGNIQFEFAGETEMFYDGQEQVVTDGQPVYLDEAGNEWKESDLILKDDDVDE